MHVLEMNVGRKLMGCYPPVCWVRLSGVPSCLRPSCSLGLYFSDMVGGYVVSVSCELSKCVGCSCDEDDDGDDDDDE